MEQHPRSLYRFGFLGGLALVVLLYLPGALAVVLRRPSAAVLVRGATGLTILVVLVLALAMVLTHLFRPLAPTQIVAPDPLAELNLRYARGEINEREYKRMREVLTSGV
ncbi:MAG TPA: SHOCT domain-containing protein [Candidatus Nitrosotalea sp.]|nr:SHOCT domain-containing protein [Candidatus Nitrosotalea sp.]